MKRLLLILLTAALPLPAQAKKFDYGRFPEEARKEIRKGMLK